MQKNEVKENIKRNIWVLFACKHFFLANTILNSGPYTV